MHNILPIHRLAVTFLLCKHILCFQIAIKDDTGASLGLGHTIITGYLLLPLPFILSWTHKLYLQLCFHLQNISLCFMRLGCRVIAYTLMN